MEDPLTPREFLHRHSLPQLIRIHEAHLHQLHTSRIAMTNSNTRSSLDSTATSSSSDSSYAHKALNTSSDEDESQAPMNQNILDLDQPFLLYKAYSSRQVIAHTLDASDSCSDLSAFQRVGPALLIPEDYTGWFSLVTSKGQTAGYFSRVDEIAKAQVPYFLTRDELNAFIVPRSQPVVNQKTANSTAKNNRSCYDTVRIKGGTALRFLGVYEDISAFIYGLKQKSSLRSKKPMHFEPGTRYAKCVSFSNSSGGDVVFIPINEVGRFYVVRKRSNDCLSYNHVYSLNDLLRLVKLPVSVQLVIGPKPRNYVPSSHSSLGKCGVERSESDSTFTAVLRLEQMRVRDVILACTLRPQPLVSQAVREKSSISSSLRRTLRGNRSLNKVDETPILLEFDLDSSFTFVRTFVEKNGTLSSRKIPELVVQRIAFCNAEAEFWRRQIKISHDVTPKTVTCSNDLRNQRKSILDEEFKKTFDKTASIGSRTSNVSNVSRISKILQKFWSPLKRSSRKADEECFEEKERNEEISEKMEKMNEEDRKYSSNSVAESTITDYHFYETLRKAEEKFYPPKQKLSRKQTLDVIFPDFKVDKNGYILSNVDKSVEKDD